MIGIEPDRFRRETQRELVILAIQCRARRFDGGINHIGQRQPLLFELQFALRDPCDVEQIIEQQCHVRHLPLDDELRALQLRRRQLRRSNESGSHADRCERIPQFVGQRGDEFILASILLA